MTAMKLQKIIYYCQAWSLVWDECPLFREDIQAWSNGPVVRELYDAHRGEYEVRTSTLRGAGDPGKLSEQQMETVEAVLEYYGNRSSQWLSDLTHLEDPWKNARQGLEETERSEEVIGLAAMQEYYGGLPSD